MPTDDVLVGLRADGDSAASSELHEAVRRSPRTAADVLRVLRKPVIHQPRWLHELLDEWVRDGPDLPSWADPELIERGQRFFNDWDLAICTALFTASLPSGYAGWRGVGVLARVSQLAEPGTVARRVGETGQLLLDISQPGALERGGVGYKRIVLVRVLHEAVREVLLGNDAPGGDWPAENGVPVNQEDLLATLMTFTVIVFRALDRMGIKATPADQRAYLHLWAVAGDLLGITEAKLLCQPPDADTLTTRLQKSLQGPSDDGAYLMSVLLREMELAMPLGWLRVPRTVVRFLIGDQVADMIEVPRAAWWRPALPAAAALNGVLHRYPLTRHLSELPSRMVGRRVIQLWIDQQQRGDDRHLFSITPERAQRWHVARDGRGVTKIRGRLRHRRQRHREAELASPSRVSP